MANKSLFAIVHRNFQFTKSRRRSQTSAATVRRRNFTKKLNNLTASSFFYRRRGCVSNDGMKYRWITKFSGGMIVKDESDSKIGDISWVKPGKVSWD